MARNSLSKEGLALPARQAIEVVGANIQTAREATWLDTGRNVWKHAGYQENPLPPGIRRSLGWAFSVGSSAPCAGHGK